ncbi:MAG: DUF3347 domain-containing protein [bacterium]
MKKCGNVKSLIVVLAVVLGFSVSAFAAEKKKPTLQSHLNDAAAGYSKIHEALSGDTVKGVRGEAKSIIKSVDSALKLAKKDEKKNKELIAALGDVKTAAEKLDAKKLDLKTARENFGPLSDAFIGLIREHFPDKLGKKYYTFYCPMVKRYWLQTSKETLNPYYGKEMLGCGKIVKEKGEKESEHSEGHGDSMHNDTSEHHEGEMHR